MSQEEELFKFVQKHGIGIGEKVSFKCPHCSKEVVVEPKALAREPDTTEVYWSKKTLKRSKIKERGLRKRLNKFNFLYNKGGNFIINFIIYKNSYKQ